MYLSGDILDWQYYNENSSGVSYDDEAQVIVWRAHQIWRHANSLISSDCSDLSIADAITSLKRAVNHRLKALTRVYCFDALPFTNQKKTLEKFQAYGLLRPPMLKDLFEVRNAIEHMDAPPPSVTACGRYVDIVWYFLKSTDSLLTMRLDDVIFWSDEGRRSLTFRPTFDGLWNIVVQGELLPEDALDSWRPGALEVDESIERPNYIHASIYGLWKPTQ